MVAIVKKTADQTVDWINVILAVLLFISPWALGYVGQTTASWNAWVVSVIIAAFAIGAIVRFANWEEWVNVVLGLWLVIAPWILGFSLIATALWSHIVLGILIAALAAWRAWSAHSGTATKATA